MKTKGRTIKTIMLLSLFLLVMKTDVMVANQYNQFGVSGVSEHPVEASHVVLPVLQREQHKHTVEARAFNKTKLPWEAHESEWDLCGSPSSSHGWLSEPGGFDSDSRINLAPARAEAAHRRPLITSVLWAYVMFVSK